MYIPLAFLIFGIICLMYFIFWLKSLIHAANNETLSGIEKIIWVLGIIFFPFLGMFLYWITQKAKLPSQPSRHKPSYREKDLV
ncbi:MAG: hypothetical protein D6714_00755 [Bacteroidetes bacterium]|nr:MAG: hypothetical protein D6714_00755 [Bacteroidota bacterium]